MTGREIASAMATVCMRMSQADRSALAEILESGADEEQVHARVRTLIIQSIIENPPPAAARNLRNFDFLNDFFRHAGGAS